MQKIADVAVAALVSVTVLSGCSSSSAGSTNTPASVVDSTEAPVSSAGGVLSSQSVADSAEAPASSADSVPAPASVADSARTPVSVADELKADIESITKIVKITEDNDPNDLIGRPTGYVAAAVIYDSRVKCDDPPQSACGATIVQWPNEQSAEERKDYIQGHLKAMPILGTEYDYVQGDLLLRITGDLKPSQAKEYEQVFEG